MASEIFLELDGVPGEAQAKGFEETIDVLSFSFGANNPSSVGTGKGSGVGKPDFSSIAITKLVDKASPKLMESTCLGTHFAEGKLTVREAGGKDPVEFYVMELKEVFVDNYNLSGVQEGGKPSESVSLSVAEFKITYQAQDETGAKSDKVEFGFNIKQNAPA